MINSPHKPLTRSHLRARPLFLPKSLHHLLLSQDRAWRVSLCYSSHSKKDPTLAILRHKSHSLYTNLQQTLSPKPTKISGRRKRLKTTFISVSSVRSFSYETPRQYRMSLTGVQSEMVARPWPLSKVFQKSLTRRKSSRLSRRNSVSSSTTKQAKQRVIFKDGLADFLVAQLAMAQSSMMRRWERWFSFKAISAKMSRSSWWIRKKGWSSIPRTSRYVCNMIDYLEFIRSFFAQGPWFLRPNQPHRIRPWPASEVASASALLKAFDFLG